MKRSEINQAIKISKTILSQYSFHLPPFAYYTLEDWYNAPLTQFAEIFEAGLGWDVTDFGSTTFSKVGLTLFTLRNTTQKNGKVYAEKVLIIQEQQQTPLHYHWKKQEDIINRAGGNLIVKVFNTNLDSDLPDLHSPVWVSIDSQPKCVEAGAEIRLEPGQSICLPPKLYHSFWAEKGAGAVLAGEVSSANDDQTDNHFLETTPRFSLVEEDCSPSHLLCNDYLSFIIKDTPP